MKVNDFLALQQPLRVEIPHRGSRLVLAFAIAADGELQAMTIDPAGGRVAFDPIEAIAFPPAVVSGPVVASGSERVS